MIFYVGRFTSLGLLKLWSTNLKPLSRINIIFFISSIFQFYINIMMSKCLV